MSPSLLYHFFVVPDARGTLNSCQVYKFTRYLRSLCFYPAGHPLPSALLNPPICGNLIHLLVKTYQPTVTAYLKGLTGEWALPITVAATAVFSNSKQQHKMKTVTARTGATTAVLKSNSKYNGVDNSCSYNAMQKSNLYCEKTPITQRTAEQD